LRSDHCIASNGLEARTPFLDRDFIEHYLNISTLYRKPITTNGKVITKPLLRNIYQKFLPVDIVWRPKEAFSDGVSAQNMLSWNQIIKNNINTIQSYFIRMHSIP